MTLNSDWLLVPVYCQYVGQDGSPRVGSVLFEAEQVVVIDGQQVASPAPLTFNLDVNGNLAAMVPANNDPHIVPTGFAWSWKVTEQFVGGRPPYFINVDFATPPPGVNLATAVPVVPPIPYVTYLTRTDIDVLVPSVGAVNALQVKTIQHYGGVADGTTNIGPAIAAAIADGAKQLRFPAAPLPYKLTQSVDFSGMQLFGDGPGTVIDATTGTFSSNFVFAASGSLSSLPNLAADVSIGASSLLFVSAPALAPGDIFCLDPTTSWSGHRSYYNAGEWCEVVAVSGSTVYLKNPLYDNYTAASVTVFKQVSKVAGIRDVTINAAASLGVISASLCANPSFSNVVGTHYGDSIISFDRCVYPTVTECQLSNYGGQGNEYAVVFGNSQHGKVVGGSYYARRNVVTTGGVNLSCNVPCRDIVATAATMKNDIRSGVESANFHGNSEFCRFVDCTILGGLSLGGADNDALNCRIGSNLQGSCVVLAEVLRGTFDFSGSKFRTFINPQSTSRGIVDAGGNSTTSINSFTTGAVTVKARGVSLYARNMNQNTAFVNLVNRGCAVPINAEINGLALDVDYLNTPYQLQYMSGTQVLSYAIVDGVVGAPAGCASGGQNLLLASIPNSYLTVGGTPMPLRMQQQSGVYQGVTPTSPAANNVVSAPITLAMRYPIIPDVHVSVMGAAGAALSYIGSAVAGFGSNYQTTTAAVRPALYSAPPTNFPTGINFELHWTAGIRTC